MKHIKLKLAWVVLVSQLAPSLAQAAFELESLEYEEALHSYREADRYENYRCVHYPANKQYQPLAESRPIAIEIDDVLYLKVSGVLHELRSVEHDDPLQLMYRAPEAQLEAEYEITGRFNPSEYGESEDRQGELKVRQRDKSLAIRTFGDRCGI